MHGGFGVILRNTRWDGLATPWDPTKSSSKALSVVTIA